MTVSGSLQRLFRRRARPSIRLDGVRLLPVPHAFGLDMSDASVEAVECARREGKTVLRAYNRVLLPEGIIRDGDVLDAERLHTALTGLLGGARPHAFSRMVLVSLPESRVYMHLFEFPPSLTERQVRDAIPYEVEGVLPIDLKEMVIDIKIHRARDGSRQHALFTAVPAKLVEQYLGVCERAGLEVVGFDTQSIATARALIGRGAGPSLLIDVGSQRATLLVVERGSVHGAVSIPVGGKLLTEVVARASHLSVEEADAAKMRAGMGGEAPLEVRAALEDALTTLIHEAQQLGRSHEHDTGRSIDDVVLAGGSALMPGLDKYLRRTLEREVRVGDPFAASSIVFSSELSAADTEWLQLGRLFFATAVGLALRGVDAHPPENGVNLLPETRRARYTLWRENLTLTALSLLTVVTGAVLFIALGLSMLRAEFSARRVTAEVEPIRAALASERFATAVGEAKLINAEIEAIRAFSAERVSALPVLERIRAAIPLGIRLVGVQVSVTPGAQKAFTVSLRGVADTREQFLEFEQRVRALQGVQTVDSPLTNLDRPVATPFILTLTVTVVS